MESSAGIAERGAPVGGVDRPVGRGERRSPQPAAAGTRRLDVARLSAHALDYLALTKPRIISLLLWTTVATMFVARPSGLALSTVLWTCLGGYLAAGGAGAINHYIDRDIDARMGRTKGRPIVSGRIEPFHALIFGICLGVLATAQLWVTVNALAAALALLGLLGYVLALHGLAEAAGRRRTSSSAAPPARCRRSSAGRRRPASLDVDALFPFLIIFLWTPPHFWALALLISDDYERTGIPMLPVVRGDDFTRGRILLYSLLLVAFTLVPVVTGLFGAIYLAPPRCSASPSSVGATRLLRAPPGGPPCSSTWARSPTCSCSSARWRPTGSSPA